MFLVLLVTIPGLLWAPATASTPSSQWDDAVCSLQTTHGMQGGNQLDPSKDEALPGGAERSSQPVNCTSFPMQPLRSQRACTGMEQIQNYMVAYSQEAVMGGMKYTYTLTPSPTPAPTPSPKPSPVKGISFIEFNFTGCTCNSPNQFSDLGLFEFPFNARQDGVPLDFTEVCDEKTDMILKFDDIDDQKGSIYTVTFTLADDNTDTTDVSMTLKAGPDEFVGNICGPICLDPTPAPTGDSATSFGDPHVGNVKGERFDILRPDHHTFLVIPRGIAKEHAKLHVLAKVDPLGPLCSGLLYVTELTFSGLWLGEVGSLEFSTNVNAVMDAEKAMQIQIGSSPRLSVSEFKARVNHTVVPEVTTLTPEEPQSLNQHVDTLLVKLKLGPTVAKVRMVYQREKTGFSNSLWLTTTGLKSARDEIGGILGFDTHETAASPPSQCDYEGGNSKRIGVRNRSRHHVHAVATLEEDLDM